ncbi:MAG: DMT family transporter [Granulosicoccus sp.]|nr:DMT family transporter [Granulosicoccus sp.]
MTHLSGKWFLPLVPGIFLLLWSGGFTVAKIGLEHANPITLLALRYGCVIVLLTPLFLLFKPALPASRAQWINLAWVGFLIQVVYFGTAWMAFKLGGSAGTVALITSLQPILVALVIPLITGEVVAITRWIGLILGLIGTCLVLLGNAELQPVSITVIALALSALLAFSIATIWEKRFGVAHHPLTSNLVQYAIGFIVTLPLALIFESTSVNVTVPFVLALTYLVIGNSLLAISLLLMMIRNGEATRVSALFFMVPPLSAFIAWLILDESMTRMAWLGMAVAACGVWLATRSDRAA